MFKEVIILKKREIYHKLLVIGAGASGMMAAIQAARAGIDTAILEHTDKIGKKLLMTGNGRCNLTNLEQRADCYRSRDCKTAWQILHSFTERDTIDFFRGLGLLTRERDGYVYPWSNQAASVLRVLKGELYRLHVPVYYRSETERLYKDTKSGKFFCVTGDSCFKSDRLILAAGSKAAAKTGSDGSGYALAGMLGHSCYPVLPALVQLTAKEGCFQRLAGVRAEGKATVYVGGRKMAEDTGELQLTAEGISGIPVFQVSRFASEGLYRKDKVRAELDFCPCLSERELYGFLDGRIGGGARVKEVLCGILNEKLAQEIVAMIDHSMEGTDFMPREGERLVGLIKRFPVMVTGTKGFESCQVCMGGVPLSELCPSTMESAITKGLYLAGELLDVDGICGGYNLQWAWTSGYLAGRSAAVE